MTTINKFEELPDSFDQPTDIEIHDVFPSTVLILETSTGMVFLIPKKNTGRWQNLVVGDNITVKRVLSNHHSKLPKHAKLKIMKTKGLHTEQLDLNDTEPLDLGDTEEEALVEPVAKPVMKKLTEVLQAFTKNLLLLNKTEISEELDSSYLALNDGQRQAFDRITTDENNSLFFITGSPGVGKTFLAKTLMLFFIKKGSLPISAIAPSHKAKKVLSEALGSDATTVARYCGYTMEDNDDTIINEDGEFVKTRHTERSQIVFIDEVSMVSDKNFQEIIESTRDKVIAMGDKNQLQAINTSSADLSKAVVLELTEQMRQGNLDTALYRNIQMIKRKIEGSTERLVLEFDDTFIQSSDLSKEFYFDKVDIIVSYRNKIVDAYNEKIQMMTRNTNEYLVGDDIILNKPLYDKEGVSVNDKIYYPILKNNGDMIKITHIHKTQPGIGKIVDVDSGEEDTRLLLSREQYATPSFIWNLWLEAYKPHMSWKDFKRFTINASLPYAVTTHKVQGSTYQSVGINLKDIAQAYNANERYRMIYVAMSRAKEKCYVRMP